MAIPGIFPEITEPDFVIELDTSTMMYWGTLASGLKLFPELLIQLPPQFGEAVEFAKPSKPGGAAPALSELFFPHCAPQNITRFPTTALRSPITNPVWIGFEQTGAL